MEREMQITERNMSYVPWDRFRTRTWKAAFIDITSDMSVILQRVSTEHQAPPCPHCDHRSIPLFRRASFELSVFCMPSACPNGLRCTPDAWWPDGTAFAP